MRRAAETISAEIYVRRKTIVELVFGQIKHRQGFRQFLLRGANKMGRMGSGLHDSQHSEAAPRLLYVIGAVECGRIVTLAGKNRELYRNNKHQQPSLDTTP